MPESSMPAPKGGGKEREKGASSSHTHKGGKQKRKRKKRKVLCSFEGNNTARGGKEGGTVQTRGRGGRRGRKEASISPILLRGRRKKKKVVISTLAPLNQGKKKDPSIFLWDKEVKGGEKKKKRRMVCAASREKKGGSIAELSRKKKREERGMQSIHFGHVILMGKRGSAFRTEREREEGGRTLVVPFPLTISKGKEEVLLSFVRKGGGGSHKNGLPDILRKEGGGKKSVRVTETEKRETFPILLPRKENLLPGSVKESMDGGKGILFLFIPSGKKSLPEG